LGEEAGTRPVSATFARNLGCIDSPPPTHDQSLPPRGRDSSNANTHP
jgi:hypothetical protein